MNKTIQIMLCTVLAVLPAAAGKSDVMQQQNAQRIELLNRIETLKNAYGRLQERYRETVEHRWKQRQEHLRVKEEYKTGIDVLRQRQEILYNELSRAKEEALVRENTVQDLRETISEKTEVADFLEKQVRDKISEAAKTAREGFPIGMEERIAALEGIGGNLARQKSSAEMLKWLFEQRYSWLREGADISIRPATILLKRGDPFSAEVLKIGNYLAYAVTASGEAYLLASGAKNRQFRFEWKPVMSLPVKTPLITNFPVWLSRHRIEGAVAVDVLQNTTSEQLFEGRKRSLDDRMLEYVKAGGPNVIVLWLVGLLAFIIAVERWFMLVRRGVNAYPFAERLLTFVKEGKTQEAERMLRTSHSALARCLRLLWRERNASRQAAEKTLREAFLRELPPLESRLSILAALAAAAPLLGLLGTVGGLITLFHVLNTAGTNDTKLLAGGISEALVNTLTGLAIAIPALIVHGYLGERAAFIQNSVQAASAEILNALWPVGDQSATLDEKVSHE